MKIWLTLRNFAPKMNINLKSAHKIDSETLKKMGDTAQYIYHENYIVTGGSKIRAYVT